MPHKHFIKFFSPGTFVSESSEREVSAPDLKTAIRISEQIVERHDATPYGFRFITKLIADPVSDGEGGMLAVESKVVSKSGMFFLGGKVETFDEVEARNLPDESILRSNMRCNGHAHVIVVTKRYKSIMPFGENDAVVSETGRVTVRGTDPEVAQYRERKLAEWERE